MAIKYKSSQRESRGGWNIYNISIAYLYVFYKYWRVEVAGISIAYLYVFYKYYGVSVCILEVYKVLIS